jgi:hypothetical protein
MSDKNKSEIKIVVELDETKFQKNYGPQKMAV